MRRNAMRSMNMSGFVVFAVHCCVPLPSCASHASFVVDMFERLAMEAGRCCRYNRQRTMTSKAIQTSVKLVLSAELAKHAISEGSKAVVKYARSKDEQAHIKH